jgi:hypothetical protein
VAEFAGEEFGDAGCQADGGSGVQKEGPGGAGEDVFDGAGDFVSGGLDNFSSNVGELDIQRFGEPGVLGGEFLDGRGSVP